MTSCERIFFFTSFSEHRPAQREWARTGLIGLMQGAIPPNPTTRKGWPHHQGLRPLLFSNSGEGSFTFHKNRSVKVLWDRTYSSLSLFEKTRKSNHLQMSLQRQNFLLSFLKTLSVDLAGVWTCNLPLSRLVLSQLSSSGDGYWTNLLLPQMGQQISWIESCIWYFIKSIFLKKILSLCCFFVAFLQVLVFYHLQDYQILSNLHWWPPFLTFSLVAVVER